MITSSLVGEKKLNAARTTKLLSKLIFLHHKAEIHETITLGNKTIFQFATKNGCNGPGSTRRNPLSFSLLEQICTL